MENELTQLVERRKDPGNQAVLMLLEELRTTVMDLKEELKEVKVKSVYGFAMSTEAIEKAIENSMHKAFPEGDPDGHRRHHEAVIKAAEDKAKFWQTMRTEISKWGLISLLGWALVWLWTGFLAGPKK